MLFQQLLIWLMTYYQCRFYLQIILIMYNLFIQKKKTIQKQVEQTKSLQKQKYVKKYYQQTRPELLNNYNKRINDFIRRIQDQPIRINLDPYKVSDREKKQLQLSKNNINLKRNYTATSINNQKTEYNQTKINPQTLVFKFKNCQDFVSLFTPCQRLERKKNYQLFKKKYGDPDIAFRSIGSQSQYRPYHQFRQRNHTLQINPPMRYTTKPTKQILANVKSKYSKMGISGSKGPHPHNSKQSQKDQQSMKKSYGLGLGDEISIGQNTSIDYTDGMNQQQTQNMKQMDQQKILHQRKSRKKQVKMHFKQVIDLQQNVGDMKTKKLLRDVLYKCGVYRRKNRRAITDMDVDQFSEFEQTHSNK